MSNMTTAGLMRRNLMLIMAFCLTGSVVWSKPVKHLPSATEVTTNQVGSGGVTAAQSVFRVLCAPPSSESFGLQRQGTAFLHKSGMMITAYHVVDGCDQVKVEMPDTSVVMATVFAHDPDIDIALLKPQTFVVPGYYLEIADNDNLSVGSQVTTWGFPGGYNGAAPLLGVGYLSGADKISLSNNRVITQWVVNAAFNSGNSGGPLVDVRSGKVIGVVDSKLSQLTQKSKDIIAFLKNNISGIQYENILPDGRKISYSEATLIANVLDNLKEEAQLVVGYASLTTDLRDFLKKNGVQP